MIPFVFLKIAGIKDIYASIVDISNLLLDISGRPPYKTAMSRFLCEQETKYFRSFII
jgi:hypothetical protein